MSDQPLTYSPFDAEVIADPYPVYRELRANSPAHWSREANSWVRSWRGPASPLHVLLPGVGLRGLPRVALGHIDSLPQENRMRLRARAFRSARRAALA